ncbi:hypothetical protein F4780DRAFT_765673 [Xylariomycetidae sp. FL0641]|nr:hypothetical protein F4780DRAFT_765673 [Xylariomycetidae sp. FL0641]
MRISSDQPWLPSPLPPTPPRRRSPSPTPEPPRMPGAWPEVDDSPQRPTTGRAPAVGIRRALPAFNIGRAFPNIHANNAPANNHANTAPVNNHSNIAPANNHANTAPANNHANTAPANNHANVTPANIHANPAPQAVGVQHVEPPVNGNPPNPPPTAPVHPLPPTNGTGMHGATAVGLHAAPQPTFRARVYENVTGTLCCICQAPTALYEASAGAVSYIHRRMFRRGQPTNVVEVIPVQLAQHDDESPATKRRRVEGLDPSVGVDDPANQPRASDAMDIDGPDRADDGGKVDASPSVRKPGAATKASKRSPLKPIKGGVSKNKSPTGLRARKGWKRILAAEAAAKNSAASGLAPEPSPFPNLNAWLASEVESIPGLEGLELAPSDEKRSELFSERDERKREKARRQKEEEARRALAEAQAKAEKERREKEEADLRARAEAKAYAAYLSSRGLSVPKTPLITKLSPEWEVKAKRAIAASRGLEIPRIQWHGKPHSASIALTAHDMNKLAGGAWLNDSIIQASLTNLAVAVNYAAGVTPKVRTPKCVAISPSYWQGYDEGRSKRLYEKSLGRIWAVERHNFLNIDQIFIPFNKNANHWVLLELRPSQRTMAYLDSMHGPDPGQMAVVREWLQDFLEDRYVESEWKTVEYTIPHQHNASDCGVFTITNAMHLALGLDPNSYTEKDLGLQRISLAAMLLNQGFTGEFSLDKFR